MKVLLVEEVLVEDVVEVVVIWGVLVVVLWEFLLVVIAAAVVSATESAESAFPPSLLLPSAFAAFEPGLGTAVHLLPSTVVTKAPLARACDMLARLVRSRSFLDPSSFYTHKTRKEQVSDLLFAIPVAFRNEVVAGSHKKIWYKRQARGAKRRNRPLGPSESLEDHELG
jgi:hypothetical protein